LFKVIRVASSKSDEETLKAAESDVVRDFINVALSRTISASLSAIIT
jgi:hypothetical protein